MHALGPSWLDPQHLIDTYALPGTLLVVFIECGLFFFLLPGDSLLFTVGLLVKEGTLKEPLWLVLVLLVAAAFAGNVAGYEIGRAAGPRVVRPGSRWIKQKHVDQTTAFFERHGARALVLGRFVPIVRTFITLIAGVGRMDRRTFYVYSGIGAVLWAVGVTLLGYFVGTVPFVRNNIEAMLIVVVLFSVLPIGFEWLRHRRQRTSTSTDA
ncbi:VTT domain-containing protein [Angustibacter peucedani]